MESRLLERWKRIDAEAEENADDEKYRKKKEEWFMDAFHFLQRLPKESHCWCMHRDLAAPLLEPFHRFFKDTGGLLRELWERMASELRVCVACVSSYYEVKEFYKAEYVEEQVNSILAVLQVLDRRRVAASMQGVLANKSGDNHGELICVLYELFTYPELLEDGQVNDVLVSFLQHVSDTIDLQLSPNQRYPGLCALLFHSNQHVRFVAHQLMAKLEPFRNAEELEPVQPVLEKRLRSLESTSRQTEMKHMTHDSLWQGFKTMLKFLYAPALEEGIVERYPTFVGVVLNHVSESSSVFWNALNCLEQLLQVLGFKLWLRSAFSPAVLRNTLLSQCFHEKDEKIHKSILSVFQHFLQSLEPMQDGQYEKQRRYLLYFLLQQVPNSSNFSALIRKFASQTACYIVTRSYKQASPPPPFECAHFWGPMVLDSIKDTGLQKPFLQPALDLAGTVLVADATALAALYGKVHSCADVGVQEEDDELIYSESSNSEAWNLFIQQVEFESESWFCIPVIWLGALDGLRPSAISSEFTKAFVWAVSRVSILDEKVLSEGESSKTVSAALVWEKPKGCDDGSDGKGCANAVKASANLLELISLLKRSGNAFALKVREQGYNEDLPWDPSMAEALLLLQMDSSSVLRKLGKDMLQRFSKDGQIDSAIQFVCENEKSLSYALKAFRHAVRLLGTKPLEHGNSLQHVFFLALKFYNVCQRCGDYPWRSFTHKLSRILWSVLVNGISHGQQCATATGYETSCTRMFELLPVVFKYRVPSAGTDTSRQVDELWKVKTEEDCPTWFRMLVSWSRISSNTIRRRWNDAILCILEDLARGPVAEQARRSEAVTKLLQPGSVLDSDQRERLVLLFSQRQHKEQREEEQVLERPAVIEIDTDEEDEDEEANRKQEQDKQGIRVQEQRKDERKCSEKMPHSAPDHAVLLRTSSGRHKQPLIPAKKTSAQRKPTPFAQKKMAEFLRSQSEKDLQPTILRSQSGKDLQPTNMRSQSEKGLQPTNMRRQSEKDLQPTSMRSQSEKNLQPTKPPASLQDKHIAKEPRHQPELEQIDDEFLTALVSDDGFVAFENARKQRASIAPITTVHPKRKVVRLDMPVEQLRPSMPFRNKARAQQRPPPPKLDDWLSRILCLDLFKDSETDSSNLVKVPRTFTSAEHYLEVFRPLLLEEFRAQLERSREDFDPEDKDKVGVSTFLTLDRVDSLHNVKFLSEPGRDGVSRTCVENDLLLISNKPYRESSSGLHILAKVDRRERANRGGGTVLQLKVCMPQGNERLNKVKLALNSRGRWHITKLCNITPQLREFQAVTAMASSPLLDVILSPVAQSSTTPSTSPMPLPEPLRKRLTSDYNDSQSLAIRASLGDSRGKTHQITLVQGPPGTGKTRTIVGIASALLAREGKRKKGKILVCAQSNAAVDEILSRLSKNGIYGSDGQFYKPVIVRAGNPSGLHPGSMPFFIDTLVDKKLLEERGKDTADDNAEDASALQVKLERISEMIAKLLEEPTREEGFDAKLSALEKQKREVTAEVQRSHFSMRKFMETDRARRKQLKSEIIRDADIVLTTLSGCGGDIYAACMEPTGKEAAVFFDAVVIDEAAQALEPATLIPLQLLATTHGTCVMVGDPKQLPATVISQVASKFSFQRSMFERFQSNGFSVTMLNVQYRMHPEIRKFPSRHFYDDQLLDGDAVLQGRRLARFHKEKLFPPYAFFDVPEGQEMSSGSVQSIANMEEISVAIELFKSFRLRYPDEAKPGRIGIITPYKRQQRLLKEEFRKCFGSQIAASIEFNTVDGFQGREVDVLILSTVRASHESKSIGFVADIRRMNVALTRARFSMWIIGNAKALQTNPAWKALLQDARARGVVSEVHKPYNRHFKPRSEERRDRDRDRDAPRDNKNKRLAEPEPDPAERQDRFKKPRLDSARGAKVLVKPVRPNELVSPRGTKGETTARGISILSNAQRREVRPSARAGDGTSTKVLDRQASRSKDPETTRRAERPPVPGLDRSTVDMEDRKKRRQQAMAYLSSSLLDSNKPGSQRKR